MFNRCDKIIDFFQKALFNNSFSAPNNKISLYFIKNRYFLAITSIILIGLIIRLKFLSNMGSYWFDEMAAITIAKFNFPKILDYLAIENNPPLSYLYLHFWIKFLGDGELTTRISSLIFGIASIPLTYFVGKEIFSRKTGLIASLFLTLSFFPIYYSVEARMYSLLLLLALSSVYFYWKILKENKRKYWIFYALSSVLLVYTHLFGWLIIIFQNAFFLLYSKRYLFIKNNLYKTDFILIFFFLPWLVPKLYSLINMPVAQGWYFVNNVEPNDIFITINELLLLNNINRNMALANLLLFVALIITSFITFLKSSPKNTFTFELKLEKEKVFLILWIVIPIFIAYNLNLLIPKYLIFIGPPFYFLIAEGIINLKLKQFSQILTIIISLILFISAWTAWTTAIYNNRLYFWDTLAGYIQNNEKPGDKIIIHSFMDTLEIRRYYKGKAPYEGFYIFDDNSETELEKLIIKHNWNNYIGSKNDITGASNKLKIITNGYKRIFLVDSDILLDPNNFVVTWFQQNNWRLIEKKEFKHSTKPIVWVWEKITAENIANNAKK